MLYSVNDGHRSKLKARDGELGHVRDVFFDDRTWQIRYVVVDTGRWLPGRQVLVPRERFGTPDWGADELEVDLTREEVQKGPGVETDPPLARDVELRYYKDHVWMGYPWGGFIGAVPPGPAGGYSAPDERAASTHLRSAREITDYRIQATDGRIGHVEDFLFAPDTWTIEYIVIDTRNWLPGRKVVVPPKDIQRMDWAEQTAHVDLTRERIRSAPELTGPTDGGFGPRLVRSR